MSLDESKSFQDIPCLIWSERQVARALGIGVKRVQQLCRQRLLPAFKIGRNWCFEPDAVRGWIKKSGSDPKSKSSTATTKSTDAQQ